MNQVGFPSELKNEIDYSLPSNVESYSVKVMPSNLSSIVSPVTSVGGATGFYQCGGSNTNIIFDIPAGQGKGVFLDPRFSTLNFRCKYEISTDNSSIATGNVNLRSSAYAHFDRCYLQSQSGVLLNDVNNYGLVNDELIALEMDVAQRDALALMYGMSFETATSSSKNANQGHSIVCWANKSAGNFTNSNSPPSYNSYSVPLLEPLIGKGASKFFQIGATNKLQLVLQTSAIAPITFNTTTAGSGAAIKFTIDNIFLNLQYVNIGEEGVKMLDKVGLQYYNGLTYRCSSATLPSTSGSVSLLTGLRGSSVRNIITRCSEASTISLAGCCNYIYDSKLPQATSIAYNINGVQVPPNPVDLLHAPSSAYSFLQEANATFNTYEFKSGLTPECYCTYIPGGTLDSTADQVIVTASTASTITTLCSWAFGYNLEKVSKAGVLDGMNLNSGNTFLNMVLANASTNTLTFFFIAKMDVIFILDTNTGEISVRI